MLELKKRKYIFFSHGGRKKGTEIVFGQIHTCNSAGKVMCNRRVMLCVFHSCSLLVEQMDYSAAYCWHIWPYVPLIFLHSRHISHFMHKVPFPSSQRPRILVQVCFNCRSEMVLCDAYCI